MAVIFTRTLDTNVAGLQGFSIRSVTDTLTAGGDQVAVRFEAASAANTVLANCSIGILGGAVFPNMTTQDRAGRTQPIELKFGGVSGVSLAPGATATSDFTVLSFYSSDNLVIVMDFSSTAASAGRLLNAGTPISQFKAATASYNTAVVSGFSAGAGFVGLNQIEGIYYQPGQDDPLTPGAYRTIKLAGY